MRPPKETGEVRGESQSVIGSLHRGGYELSLTPGGERPAGAKPATFTLCGTSPVVPGLCLAGVDVLAAGGLADFPAGGFDVLVAGGVVVLVTDGDALVVGDDEVCVTGCVDVARPA